MKSVDRVLAIMLAATILALMFAITQSMQDASAEKAAHDLRCEMVSLYIESEGQHGWPPSENWREICADWIHERAHD